MNVEGGRGETDGMRCKLGFLLFGLGIRLIRRERKREGGFLVFIAYSIESIVYLRGVLLAS